MLKLIVKLMSNIGSVMCGRCPCKHVVLLYGFVVPALERLSILVLLSYTLKS
jgi:hypothetical protein